MTLSLAQARDLVDTELEDTGLQLLIDAVNADIERLGGHAYPMRFSGALLEISAVAASGADMATSRSFFGAAPAIGNPLIRTTDTALTEISYTLAAINSGTVTVTIEGESAKDNESLSSLADNALEELGFYIVGRNGRIELGFEDAETADTSMPDQVQWQVASARRDAARTLLTGVSANERILFAIANRHAGLRMPAGDWQAALDRIAVSCLRIAVTDEGVASYMDRGGDAQQALEYLQYSSEYRARLNQVLDLTGGWFA